MESGGKRASNHLSTSGSRTQPRVEKPLNPAQEHWRLAGAKREPKSERERTRPPEDTRTGDWRRREAEHLGLPTEELHRWFVKRRWLSGGEKMTYPVGVGPVKQEREHLVSKKTKGL